jgi:hypothetical protein
MVHVTKFIIDTRKLIHPNPCDHVGGRRFRGKIYVCVGTKRVTLDCIRCYNYFKNPHTFICRLLPHYKLQVEKICLFTGVTNRIKEGAPDKMGFLLHKDRDGVHAKCCFYGCGEKVLYDPKLKRFLSSQDTPFQY